MTEWPYCGHYYASVLCPKQRVLVDRIPLKEAPFETDSSTCLTQRHVACNRVDPSNLQAQASESAFAERGHIPQAKTKCLRTRLPSGPDTHGKARALRPGPV